MKNLLWSLWLGIIYGAKAGVLGAWLYIFAHAILRLTLVDPENPVILMASFIGLYTGGIIGLLLGVFFGLLIGIVILSFYKLISYAPLFGLLLGAAIGLMLGVEPFPLEINPEPKFITINQYHAITRLLAMLSGALAGYYSGIGFRSVWIKDVFSRLTLATREPD
jgi:hypothetical protein